MFHSKLCQSTHRRQKEQFEEGNDPTALKKLTRPDADFLSTACEADMFEGHSSGMRSHNCNTNQQHHHHNPYLFWIPQ
jgi:hypothetical protein